MVRISARALPANLLEGDLLLAEAKWQVVFLQIEGFIFAKFMKKFLNSIKIKFFATETRKRSVENLKPSIDNMIIILYFVQNLNKT
jgi:hypothetical protein